MKKLVFACCIGFWSAVATILAIGSLSTAISDEGPSSELPVYTMEQVAAHNRVDDCWMVIENHVYDFTDYIPSHPTPARVMEAWCGREATEGMRTKGYGRDHSPAAWAMMARYRIGVVAVTD